MANGVVFKKDTVKEDRSLYGSRQVSDLIVRGILFAAAVFGVLTVFFILLFLLKDGIPAFASIGLYDFLFGEVWNPAGANPSYGTLPLWVGTLLVTLGAMLIAAPLGIASAVYISEIASARIRSVIKPAVELLAGIPSVVYGFFGLVILTDWLRVTFDLATGECWLAGSILLGIMALPTIISVSEDAINAVPDNYRRGSLGLGATYWQTISKVIVPAALSGITAAIILGMGRAIGETMAVMMVTGNSAIIPDPIYNIFSPVRTLTGTLGIEMGEVAVGSEHYHALFGVAILLLVITLVVNMSAHHIIKRIRAKGTGSNNNGRKKLSLPVSFSAGNLAGHTENLKKYMKYALGVVFLLVLLYISVFLFAAAVALFLVWKYYLESLDPKKMQKLAYVLLYISIGIVLVVLAIILYDIISKGLPAMSWEFLTSYPKDLGREGGIFPAIIGTLYLVGGAILFALPIGVGAAIYLVEYTGEGRITSIIRSGVDLLNGTPSIVFGLFGFAFLVLFLDFGVCLLAGMITLGLMVLPTIIRTTEEALKSVPDSLRHGSLALGATKWQTIRKVVLSPAAPGIITGTILSIGRAAGETAPIMFTAVVFTTRFLPASVFDPVMCLPYHLFILSTNVPGATTNQYGTALVLLLIVMAFYFVAILIRNHYHKSLRW
jgi:phosphate transport system permease protein